MQAAYDAVLWDHDGLLVDTEELFFRVTGDVLGEAGVALSEALWSREYLSKGIGTAAFLTLLGLPEARREVLIAERNRRYRQGLLENPPLRPAVRETLEFLSGKVPMAIVTGSPRADIEAVHRNTGLLGLFTAVVTREDYARQKPAPDAYLEGARRMGVSPVRALAVEDSERGLNAALAAGVPCLAIPSRLTRDHPFPGALAIETTVAAVIPWALPSFRNRIDG